MKMKILGLMIFLTFIYSFSFPENPKKTKSIIKWDRYLEIIGLFGGGLAGMFIAGIFTKRTNSAGLGLGFSFSGLILFIVKSSGAVHFFLYSFIGIFSCFIIGWIAILCMPSKPKNLDGLTIYSIYGKDKIISGKTKIL